MGRGRLQGRWLAAVALVVAMAVGACATDGTDDAESDDASPDAAATTPASSAGGDADAFCALTAELDSQSVPPTNAQMEEVKRLRPDEIGADADAVAEAFIAVEGDVGSAMGDPEIRASMDVIDAWTASNCPDAGTAAGDVDPAFAAYCAASAALEDGIPTAEQFRELLDLAPDAIAEPAVTVADLLEAQDGNVEEVLADPAGQAAIGDIMAWEASNCVGGGDDSGENGDLEPADGATVVPVVGVDFAYEGVPTTLAAGPVAFEFTNEGDAIHEAILFALDGATVDERVAEAMEAFERGEDEDVDFFRGYAFRNPGEDPRWINADLAPGEYALVCLIPGPDGASHLELGMGHTFTVE